MFYLKKSKASNGKAPIYARITVDKKRAEISVKQSVDEKLWSADQGMGKGNRDEIRSLNIFLEQFRSMIVSRYQEMLVQKKIITAEAIKNSFQVTGVEEFTLFKVYNS